MTISKGVGLAVGFGPETTYGTPVVPTMWSEALSSGLVLKQSAVAHPTIRTRSSRYYAPSKKETSGPIETLANYAGGALGLLLKNAMGAVSTSGPNGDGAYTHTFNVADALPAGLTFEIKPDSGELAKNLRFAGCKIAKLGISVEPEQIARMNFEVMGDGTSDHITANATTYPTFVGVDWDDLAATFNGSAVKVHSLNLDLDNGLANFVPLGQRTAQAVEPASERKVTGSVTLLLDGETQLNLFKAMTEVNAVFTFTGPTAAGATAYSMAIRIPRLVFNQGDVEVNNDGPIMLTLPFDAFYDITNSIGEMRITLVNLTTSI